MHQIPNTITYTEPTDVKVRWNCMDREREFYSLIVLNATQKSQDNITTYYHCYRCWIAKLSHPEVYLPY